MSKYVRIEDGKVRETIPDAATEPSIAHWYGAAFAAQCVEAPDDAAQGWIYDAATGTFSAPDTVAADAAAQIAALKAQLAETDYRVIKCAECSLAGLDAPYDIAGLHTERQALRDRINELGG